MVRVKDLIGCPQAEHKHGSHRGSQTCRTCLATCIQSVRRNSFHVRTNDHDPQISVRGRTMSNIQACRCTPACVVEQERTCRHKVSHSVTKTRAPKSTESESANLVKISVSVDAQLRSAESVTFGTNAQTPNHRVTEASSEYTEKCIQCRTNVPREQWLSDTLNERLCECVPAGVHCGVLFRVRSAARSLNTRAFLRERLPHLPRPHTMDSPLPRPLCATRQDPEPLALFPLDNN